MTIRLPAEYDRFYDPVTKWPVTNPIELPCGHIFSLRFFQLVPNTCCCIKCNAPFHPTNIRSLSRADLEILEDISKVYFRMSYREIHKQANLIYDQKLECNPCDKTFLKCLIIALAILCFYSRT